MKQIKYSIIIVLLFLCNVSCKKDFLDVPNQSSLLRQVYVTDLKTMEEYLKGVYLKSAANVFSGLFIIYGELVADNVKPNTGSAILGSHYAWNQKVTDGSAGLLTGASAPNLNEVWYNGYKVIRDCSFILENIGKYEDENHANADNIKGQAYALRAFVHFALVNAFAQSFGFTADASHIGIPYVTTSDWSEPISRKTVSVVYDNIISDFENAASFLPSGPISDARFLNRNAVEALLARVHLFKGNFSAARNYARQVIANVPFMTNTPAKRMYPDSLFCKGESEALFQMYPEMKYAQTYFSGAMFRLSYMMATTDIVDILKERPADLRNSWVVNSSGKWSVTKFPENKISGITPVSVAYYHTLLRSSEMYLVAAEACARLGQEDDARFYLDKIRQRADVTASNSTATGAALLDSIYKERRKELAFEGLRIYDLQRWKKNVNRLDASNPSARELPFFSDKVIAPIPATDVTLAGLQQNPSY